MIIRLDQFGPVVLTRDSGREAFALLLPILATVNEGENVFVDFTGMRVFSPGWGDEVLSRLHERFAGRLILGKTQNQSVLAVVDILE